MIAFRLYKVNSDARCALCCSFSSMSSFNRSHEILDSLQTPSTGTKRR